MAVTRSLRRTSPITLALSAVLIIGLLFFLFSPSESPSSLSVRQRKSQAAAANPLSPPTSAVRKGVSKAKDGQRLPPPVVHYKLNNLTATAHPIENEETVLILTPLARFYQEYWDNLVKLSYPHEFISLGFIIPKTREGNLAFAALQAAVSNTQSGPESLRFKSITILRQDFEPPLISQDEKERHKMSNQVKRRSSMSKARNSLWTTLLGPSTAWVLWLDGDVVETPQSLIQDMASHNKPLLVPNCMQRYYDNDLKHESIRAYDYNSWRDSDTAQQLAAKMGPDEILLEGYAEMPTYRTLMAMLADKSDERDQRKIMALDGVGGTALLVKAEVHRDGAMFPPFPFYHMMETEGFAKMARRLGWESFGLPNYFVSGRLAHMFKEMHANHVAARCTTTTNRHIVHYTASRTTMAGLPSIVSSL